MAKKWLKNIYRRRSKQKPALVIPFLFGVFLFRNSTTTTTRPQGGSENTDWTDLDGWRGGGCLTDPSRKKKEKENQEIWDDLGSPVRPSGDWFIGHLRQFLREALILILVIATVLGAFLNVYIWTFSVTLSINWVDFLWPPFSFNSGGDVASFNDLWMKRRGKTLFSTERIVKGWQGRELPIS